MQPHVVKQGDYLLKVAFEGSFDADAVWGNAKNADLQTRRKDPNILAPGDVLFIPDAQDGPDPKSVEAGSTSTFVSPAPPTPVTVKFSDSGLASQPCTIAELPDLTGLTTDGEGVLTFQAPVSLETATIAFASVAPAVSFTCQIGCLDPIETLPGIFQRLKNLGYIDEDVELEEDDLDVLRGALNALKIALQGPPSGAPLTPATTSDQGTDTPPPSEPAPASPDDAPTDEAPSLDGPSGPLTLAPRGLFGLSDEGVLDDDTAEMLRTAYGC